MESREAKLLPYGGMNISHAGRFVLTVCFLAFCLIYGAAFALVAPSSLTAFAIPIVFVGLFVVWALPDMKRGPTRMLEICFDAFLLLLIIWPDYIALALPGLPWITVTRITGLLLVVTLVTCLSVSNDFRKTMKLVLSSVPILWKTVLIFAAIALVSVFPSREPEYSIDKFVSAQISWTAIFFISVYIFSTGSRFERWARYLWFAALVVAALGLVEYFESRLPWAGHIPSFLKIEDPSVLRSVQGIVRSATGRYRVQGPFGSPLGFAEFVTLSIPFIVYFGIDKKQSLIVRLATVPSLALLLFVTIETNSRLGMVGWLFTFLLYPLIWAIKKWRTDKQSILAALMIVGYPTFFCASVAATFFVGRIHALIWGNSGSEMASTAGRVVQYTKGLPMVLSHPVGYGIGMAAETLDYHEPSGLLTIDTYYLAVVLEYGILGFAVYYGMIAMSVVFAIRGELESSESGSEPSLFASIAISLINFLVIKSVFSQQGNHPLIFMMMGGVVSLTYLLRAQKKVGEPSCLSG